MSITCLTDCLHFLNYPDTSVFTRSPFVLSFSLSVCVRVHVCLCVFFDEGGRE